MSVRDFQEQHNQLSQAAKVVNKFESEQVQLRVIDALIAALQAPDRDEPGPGVPPGMDPSPELAVDVPASANPGS
jgi:hypothetical protein